jgi:hypothetical protein
MPTSGTKWPEGYKGFVSAEKPPTPVLTLVSTNNDSVTLSWTVTNDDCIPISSYNIYLNGQIYTTVSYTTKTITISGLYCSNSFNVTSVSRTIESDKSNTVISNNILFSITGGGSSINTSGTYTVTFTSTGSITVYCPVTNQSILCIGGGGGGGGGSNFYAGNDTNSAGGGGGGGGVLISTGDILFPGVINNITVGSKGTPGNGNLSGLDGGDSSFSNVNGTIISNGGLGGKGHFFGCGGGLGGSGSITSFTGTVYNGGNGGNGGQFNPSVIATDGSACAGGFSGGGGGGSLLTNTPGFGGGAGNMGTGGILGSSVDETGISATSNSYGSGGGGAGCPALFNSSTGGSGADGTVIITFTYP